MVYTGWPKKNATLAINRFQENQGQNEKVVCIIAYRILFRAR